MRTCNVMGCVLGCNYSSMRGWHTVAAAVMGPNSPLEAPSCVLLEMALLYGFC